MCAGRAKSNADRYFSGTLYANILLTIRRNMPSYKFQKVFVCVYNGYIEGKFLFVCFL